MPFFFFNISWLSTLRSHSHTDVLTQAYFSYLLYMETLTHTQRLHVVLNYIRQFKRKFWGNKIVTEFLSWGYAVKHWSRSCFSIHTCGESYKVVKRFYWSPIYVKLRALLQFNISQTPIKSRGVGFRLLKIKNFPAS